MERGTATSCPGPERFPGCNVSFGIPHMHMEAGDAQNFRHDLPVGRQAHPHRAGAWDLAGRLGRLPNASLRGTDLTPRTRTDIDSSAIRA